MYTNITTFEAACEVAKVNPSVLPDVSLLPEKFQKWLIAGYKLAIITQAVNTDEAGKVWEPDYNDDNQYKYYPWFWVEASEEKPAGFGFSHSNFGCDRTFTDLGARLCFQSREQVSHVQKHFKDLYLEYLLILK